MRYLKTLFVSLLAFVGTAAFAQTWTGSEAAEGTFYLYNVGTGKWFCGGNNWGTHASVRDVCELDVVLAGGNGVYTIDTKLSNGGNSHFLNGEWCDGGAYRWTFTEAKTEDGSIAYLIGNGQQNLTASNANTLVTLTASTDAFAQWVLVSRAELDEKMAGPITGSVDATFFIQDPNFGRNNTRVSSWRMNASNQNLNGGANDNMCAESWRSSFTLSQALNVPNGRYQVKAQAALTDYANKYDGANYPVVYANDVTSVFNEMETADRGTSMTQLSNAFTAGKYEVGTLTVDVNNGSLTVGVRGTRTDTWCIWDNFRLYFQGNLPILKDLIAKANELLPTLNETNAAALQEAIDAAQQVADNEKATQDELEKAVADLQEAYNTADAENIAKKLAYDVLNQVPAALFPADFDWTADRPYKVWKNNTGKYALASRLSVAALINLLQFAEAADEEVKAKISENLDSLAAELGVEDNLDFEDAMANCITYMTRVVVESHGVAAALQEQNEPGYSKMYDAVNQTEGTDYYNWYAAWMTGTYYALFYGEPLYHYFLDYPADRRPYYGIEPTLSDTYEMIYDLFGNYVDPENFDADFTAHITNPDLAEGTEGWEVEGWNVISGESLVDGATTLGIAQNNYSYFDNWSAKGFTADAHQTIQLPAGRYMLTVAGRGSADIFTEVGAQDPTSYLQAYVINDQGVKTMQSITQIGNKGGVFDLGWNDASVFFTVASVGNVTVGVRAQSVKEGWASATRFRLTRLGDETIYLDEDETFKTELSWDPLTYHFADEAAEAGYNVAPVDMLLKKQMEAGKWYSIALPGDVTAEQLVQHFGEDVELAVPVETEVSPDGSQVFINFVSYQPAHWYGLITPPDNSISDYFNGYLGLDVVEYPTGILANTPMLIKPGKVSQSNRYLFKNVTSTETKNVFEDGKWSWGAYSLSLEEGNWWYTTGDSEAVKLYPNYQYQPKFTDAYTIEFNDTLKAFQSVIVAPGYEVAGVGLYVINDEGSVAYDSNVYLDIVYQQLNDAIALGEQKAEWYAGIPAAISKGMTTLLPFNTIWEVGTALKSIKNAISEGQKAYEPSLKFHALMAEAEELLASDHDELVEGADADFKKLLENFKKSFDELTTADAIVAMNKELAAALDEYKTKVAPKIEVGDVMIFNVGAQKFLGGGNSWGTRASLTEHGDYFTLARLENGAYTLESRYNNGGEQYYIGTNYFVDNGTPMEFTIASVGNGLYTIACTGDNGFGYLGWDGSESTEVRVLTDKASNNAKWTIVSVATMTEDLANATIDEPKDATFLLKDANFSRNHRDAAAWEGDGFSKGGDNANLNAEKWGGNSQEFDIKQTANVPDGVYRLTFNGYYRYNNTEENTNQVAIDTHKDGTEVINSFVYANAVEVPFKSIADEEAVEALGEANLPFSQAAAGTAFAQGLYQNDLFVKVEDGKLVVGIKKINHPGCDWTVWDNFALTYYGDVALEDVKTAVLGNVGGEATGINDLNAAEQNVVIYNLNGVRVKNMNQKGIYIVNGKKVTVK